MHPAPAFLETDEAKLMAHLARYPFVTLTAAPDGRPRVAHAPAILRRLAGGGLVLDFHLSRGNALAPFITGGFRAVAVSLGPDAYVSPDWYADKGSVPSWNYVTVEIEGPVAPLDQAGLIAQVDDITAQQEAGLAPKPPWTKDKMAPGKFERLLRSIVGARLSVERLEGTWKLSQNKTADDHAGVMQALGDHPIVALMRAAIPPR
jgi:transcriptional regulator